MKTAPLKIALLKNRFIVNPLTREHVPLAKIFQRLTYIMRQPYYQVHKTSLREMVITQMKRDDALEIERQKMIKFESVVQLIGGPRFDKVVINAKLTKTLMNLLGELTGPYAPSFEDFQEFFNFEELKDHLTEEMRHLITQEYTEKNWNSFANLFNSVMKSS